MNTQITKSVYTNICGQIADIVYAKNHDYNRAFEKSFDRYGWATYFIRITDKLNRLEALTLNNADLKVKDESVQDTLLDIIGYSLLLYEIINRKNKEEIK